MSSAIYIKKSTSFSSGGLDRKGLGFTSSGALVIINEDGTTESISSSQGAIVANKGIGPEGSLPVSFTTGDVYVTNDSYRIFVAISTVAWTDTPLESGQLITDISTTIVYPPLYQFSGSSLITLSPSKVVTNSLDFSLITFDANGVSTSTLASVYSFYYDINYIYMKRIDDYWIRSKIYKEETPPGGLPE